MSYAALVRIYPIINQIQIIINQKSILMKKFLSLLALSCLGMAASAQTVIAHMQDFVSAKTVGTMPEAVSTWETSVQGGGIYNFNGSSYIGGCALADVDAAFKGSNIVTVAAWVYGLPGTDNCIFGYGEQNTGWKFMMSGKTFKATTKGKWDFDTSSATTQIAADQWNLIAFAVPGSASTNTNIKYYASATDGQLWTKNQITDARKMGTPSTNMSAVGSGNQGTAREAYNGMIANLVVIESSDFLTNSAIKTLIGDAPTRAAEPEYYYSFTNTTIPNGARKINSATIGGVTVDFTDNNSMVYNDNTSKTFEIEYTTQPLTTQFTLNGGSWIHGYVYIDLDDDKHFTVTDPEELVTKSTNQSSSPDLAQTGSWNTFACPPVGTYRMRLKTDWANTNPAGSTGIELNQTSGQIIDVMLRVTSAAAKDYTVNISSEVAGLGENVTIDGIDYTSGATFNHEPLATTDVTVSGLPSYMTYTVDITSDYTINVDIHYAYYHALKRAETLEVGKKYMIYNACSNGANEDRTGFMYGAPNVTHDGVHTNPLTSKLGYQYLWTLEHSVGNPETYYIKNVSTSKYASSNGVASASGVDLYIQPWATATIDKGANLYSYNRYHEVVNNDFDNVFAIARNTTGGNNDDCWNGNPAQFTTWSNSHPWAFYEVCGVEDAINNDILEIARDYAAHKVEQNASHAKYGTFLEATTASTDALSASNTFDEYVAAINGVVTRNVVTPAPGTFVRIKGVSNKYISGTAATENVSSANRRVMTDSEDDAIFWYGADSKLVGYKSGQGFASTCEVAAVGAEMDAQTFGGDATSASGTLTIMGDGSYFYDHNDVYGVVNRNGTNHQTNCDWTVTDVTTLPVALTQVGELAYATFNAPVAVAVPSGVTAYSASVNGSVLELTAFEGANLAANTPVILTAETAGNYNFNIVESGDAIAGNDLLGTVAKKNVAAGKTTYVLNYNSENKIGFYKSTTFVNGFKAYTETASGESNALSFRFEDVVTAIEAIQSENSGAEIYDLQGRRLTKAQKGMNIINGHKVLVK